LYPATDGQQTGNNFVADNMLLQHVAGNKQHVEGNMLPGNLLPGNAALHMLRLRRFTFFSSKM